MADQESYQDIQREHAEKLADESLTANSFAEVAKLYLGQKIAVMCARYCYRGRVIRATSDCFVLGDATAVEITGPADSQVPRTEDPLRSSVIVRYDFIETLLTTRWALSPLPSEEGYTQNQNNN